MPNWCNNLVTFSGKSKDAQEELAVIEEALRGLNPGDEEGEAFCISNILPQPEDITDAGDVGYNWRCEHWGTKWSPSCSSVTNSAGVITYDFDTAWGPISQEVLEALMGMFPMVDIEHLYAEGGCDFSGEIKVKKGKIVSDKEGGYGDYYGDASDDDDEEEDTEDVPEVVEVRVAVSNTGKLTRRKVKKEKKNK